MNFPPPTTSSPQPVSLYLPIVGDELMTYQMLECARRTSVWLVPKMNPAERHPNRPGYTNELVVYVRGHPRTAYERAIWAVNVKCSPHHPYAPPEVRLLNRGVFHPNICPETGAIPFTKRAWHPQVNLIYIAHDLIRRLMAAPVAMDIVNWGAYNMYLSHRWEFIARARHNTELTANERETCHKLMTYLQVPVGVIL